MTIRRSIKIEGLDTELELSKVTAITGLQPMIHLDKLNDGTWRLIYSKDLIPDLTQVSAFSIIRDDDYRA